MAIQILEKVSSKLDADKIIYQLNSRNYLVETRNEVYQCTIDELHHFIKNEKIKNKKHDIRLDNIFEYLCDGVWLSKSRNFIWKSIYNPPTGYNVSQIFYRGIVKNNIERPINTNLIEINGDVLKIVLPIFRTWALLHKTNGFVRQAFFEYNNKFYYIPYGNQSNFHLCVPGMQSVSKKLTDWDVYHNIFQTAFTNHGYSHFNANVKSENIIIDEKTIKHIENLQGFIDMIDHLLSDPKNSISKFDLLVYISANTHQNNIGKVINCFKQLSHNNNPFNGKDK